MLKECWAVCDESSGERVSRGQQSRAMKNAQLLRNLVGKQACIPGAFKAAGSKWVTNHTHPSIWTGAACS